VNLLQVYFFSGGKIKIVVNKSYTNIKNNYEINFDMSTEIRPCINDQSIKEQNFNFVLISKLFDIEPNSFVDVIGVVKSATDVSEVGLFIFKSLIFRFVNYFVMVLQISIAKLGGKMTSKRELVLIDPTEYEVRITLWGEKAHANDHLYSTQPIVAFRLWRTFLGLLIFDCNCNRATSQRSCQYLSMEAAIAWCSS
jgi:replication factor A1